MINLILDDLNYVISDKSIIKYYTILQFAFLKQINIPCFCYHEKLSIAGNCRMCIVQVNNNLGVSCAINLMNNMIIYTNNIRIKEARESVLEFLLINHPLDCPICDQGGECDLQDLSLIFGSDRGRFYEDKKRAVDNFSQNGPLIKTIMTRCIHCTRCVRYANEISDFTLGLLDRGSNMEIGTYYNLNLLDEISGNIIDLCPVGASTSMPYAFKYRPWEIVYYSNIDFLDSLCSSIRLHIYANKIVRVLPLLDEFINEEWISNRTRFAYDALLINRNYYPKLKFYNKFIVFSWDFIIKFLFFYLLKNLYLNNNLIGFLGYYIDLASSLAIKTFFLNYGCCNYIYTDNLNWVYDYIYFIYFNNTIESLEYKNFFLFLNCDMRLEAPLLNIRLKKNYNLNKNLELFYISFGLSLKYSSYPIKHLGNSMIKFLTCVEGKLRYFSNFFIKEFITLSFLNNLYFFYLNPVIFLGNSILLRNDAKSFFYTCLWLLKTRLKFATINIVNSYIGFYSIANIIYKTKLILKNARGFIYNLSGVNVEDYIIDINHSFIVNQNFFNNYINCNLVLPIASPYEIDMLILNLEGRYRLIKQSLKSSIMLYANWEIFSFLILYNKKFLPFYSAYFLNFFSMLKYFKFLLNYFCNFFMTLEKFFIEFFFFTGYTTIKYIINFKNLFNFKLIFQLKFINNIFFRFINNYYNMDFFTKNSKIMAYSALKKFSYYK